MGLLLADLKTYALILRERKDFMHSFQAGAPLVGAVEYARLLRKTTNIIMSPIGEDASKGPAYRAASKPVFTIVVAGETARAQKL